MTLEPPSPQLQAWIDSVRPTPPVDEAMAQRVRARVFATVGLGVAAGAAAAAAPAAPVPPSGVISAFAGLTKPAVLVVGLAIGAGVGGGAGAWWGTQRSAAVVAVAPVEEIVAPVAPVAPLEPVERSHAAVPAVRAVEPQQKAVAVGPAASVNPDLALLQQARAALARGAVLEARKALVTHRARFDQTPHVETREALDVLVLWASSSPVAKDATERFFKAWPDSAFQGAIRRAAETSSGQ